jgi:hypothetical protein
MEESRLWRKEHVSRRSWKRQATYVEPRALEWFTKALARHFAPFAQAILIADQVIFDVPKELTAARLAAGETRSVYKVPGHVIGGDVGELERMLYHMYGFDFRVLFAPSAHALRADHDGFTTVFSMSTGWMAALKKTMRDGGVEMIAADRWTADPP